MMERTSVALSSIEYSAQFQESIRRLHRGMEARPNFQTYIDCHLSGPESRLAQFERQLVPEIQHHCGSLESLRVLDFGCGTGATTVALAAACPRVVGLDLDAESLEICRDRLAEHQLEERVEMLVAGDLMERAAELGSFDLILLNGVIEHIPLSLRGLRRKILRRLFDLLRPGGSLFIADTPNRLIPHDSHTTGLWWIPWSRPGSAWAFQRCIEKGRYLPAETRSSGSIGLEEEGAWGATYGEILSYLDRERVRVLNLEPGHSERVHFAFEGSPKRRIFERAMHPVAVRLLRIPLTALVPYLDNLVLQKHEEGPLPIRINEGIAGSPA